MTGAGSQAVCEDIEAAHRSQHLHGQPNYEEGREGVTAIFKWDFRVKVFEWNRSAQLETISNASLEYESMTYSFYGSSIIPLALLADCDIVCVRNAGKLTVTSTESEPARKRLLSFLLL